MGHRPLQKLLNKFTIMEKQTENSRHHKNYNFAKREKQ